MLTFENTLDELLTQNPDIPKLEILFKRLDEQIEGWLTHYRMDMDDECCLQDVQGALEEIQSIFQLREDAMNTCTEEEWEDLHPKPPIDRTVIL